MLAVMQLKYLALTLRNFIPQLAHRTLSVFCQSTNRQFWQTQKPARNEKAADGTDSRGLCIKSVKIRVIRGEDFVPGSSNLAVLFAERALNLAVSVSLGQGLAFVVQLFTTRQGYFQLGTAVFQVEHGGNGR